MIGIPFLLVCLGILAYSVLLLIGTLASFDQHDDESGWS